MTVDPPRPAAWVGDVVLALAVAVALSAVITIAQAAAGTSAPAAAYLFAAGFGAMLLARRRVPVMVLALAVLGTFAYYTLELPSIGVALPVVAALFSAAEQGRTRWAIGAGTVVFVVAMGFRVRDDPQPLGTLLGTDAATNIGLLAAAIALGSAVRSHRVRSAQQAQIARLQEERNRHEAQLRLREERERISRELHDTVGHSLSVISLHAGVAGDAVGHDDAAVSAALAQVRGQASASLQELRSMVRLLRTEDTAAADDPDAARHVRSLADVPALLDPARAAGVEVTSTLEADPARLSAGVDTAAYRIVQESVTNVLRHARARTLRVTTELTQDRLHLVVADDGSGADRAEEVGAEPDGVGLAGMRERARLLGGELEVATAPGAGFTVTADLPTRLPDPGPGSDAGPRAAADGEQQGERA